MVAVSGTICYQNYSNIGAADRGDGYTFDSDRAGGLTPPPFSNQKYFQNFDHKVCYSVSVAGPDDKNAAETVALTLPLHRSGQDRRPGLPD
jgi:hypothetical protein